MPPSVLPPKAKARAAAEIAAEAARLFTRIDTNWSGTIDAGELLKHMLEAGVDTDEISRTGCPPASSQFVIRSDQL